MGTNEEVPWKALGGVIMNEERVKMKAQDPNVRNKNFE